jgi:hypothetical protein
MRDGAAKWRQRGGDDKARVDETRPIAEPQRLRAYQIKKIIDDEPPHAAGGNRFAMAVFRQQPKIVVAELNVFRIENLIEADVAVGLADRRVCGKVATQAQRNAYFDKKSGIIVNSFLDDRSLISA